MGGGGNRKYSVSLLARERRKAVRVLVATSLALFIANMCDTIFLSFFSTYASDDLGMRQIEIAMVFSSMSLFEVVSSPLMGVVSERVGRASVLVSGLVLVGIGTMGFVFARSLLLFMFLRALQGIGDGAIGSTVLALLLDHNHDGEDLDQAMGKVEGVAVFGYLVGPALGGWLYEEGGFKLPFLIVGLVTIVVCAPFVWVLLMKKPKIVLVTEDMVNTLIAMRPDPDDRRCLVWVKEQQDGRDEIDGPDDERDILPNHGSDVGDMVPGDEVKKSLISGRKEDKHLSIRMPSVQQLFHSPLSDLCLLGSFVCGMGLDFLDTTLPPHLIRDEGCEPYVVGLVFAVGVICYALSSVLSGPIRTCLGTRKVLVVGAFVIGIGYVLMGVSLWLDFVGIGVIGLGLGTLIVAAQAGMADALIPMHFSFGAAYGILFGVHSVGEVCGPIMGVLFFEVLDSYRWTFFCFGFLVFGFAILLGVAGYMTYSPKSRTPTDEGSGYDQYTKMEEDQGGEIHDDEAVKNGSIEMEMMGGE
eukprot:TRINITY_DN45796_c0_g1_i1.p1 TRINITY_DN45796_c0_g1~~TRINITY_DN45796_c0_g1_i1.p1  ORF type:complete len:527 (-),score=137.16 TRINITY_DN45796_c0_g1_i1:30-1610(-)